MLPINTSKNLVSRIFNRRKKTDSAQALAVKIIVNSGKFDSAWYLAEYDDVASNTYWKQNPELHYLLHGGFEERNPNSWFNSDWYLSSNADVAEQKINPLLHYILHGSKEGRFPNPDKKTSKRKGGKKQTTQLYSDVRGRLALHLWGGLSASSLTELEAIYTNAKEISKERWSAAWHASRWHYFVGDFDRAYEIGLLMLELDETQKNRKEGVFLRAFCEFQLGHIEKAKATLKQYIKIKPKDTDALFALANAFIEDDCERLKMINSAYESNALLPISLRDELRPLDFSNIVVKDVPQINDSIKVSIIMPVFSAAKELHIAVGSLLNQSWKNLEIVIVDDCSPDGTFEVAKSMAKVDSRIIALQQEVNGGAYAARNTGLKHASGDFITTHDSDDWSHPQKIETQVKYFKENPEMVGICTHWIRAKYNLTFTQNWRPNNSLTHWSQSSFMFKRKVYEELGGWDQVRIGGDTEFIWRVKAKYGKSAYAQIAGHIPLAFALDDESSLTRTKMTHVRTVYFGLRHIYRETCAWWHKTNADLNIDGLVSRTSFAIPKSMVSRDGKPIEVDALFVSDFSNDDISAPIYELIDKVTKKGMSVGIFHWPEFSRPPTNLADKYFELLELTGVSPVVGGEAVDSDFAIYASHELLQHPVDMAPVLGDKIIEYVLSPTGEGALDDTSRQNSFEGNASFIDVESLHSLFERQS